MNASVCAGAVAAVLSVVAAAPAQQPKVTNAQVSVRNGADLQEEIAAVKTPTWIGYSVPLQHALRTNYDDSVTYLEGNPRHDEIVSEPKAGDSAARGNVLLRADGGAIQKVRIEETDREIDGGGLPFVWLTDVRPGDSVKTIAAAIDAGVASSAHMPLESGLLVIALENAPEALPALRGFTVAKYPLNVREKAAFWLANERGREGFDTVSALLKSDKDDAFRAKLVFDLTLVKGGGKKPATDELLDLAKNDAAPKVRSQAQFWLAQMVVRKFEGGLQDSRIAHSLVDSAQNDPNAAMRKSAVFALSRLPAEQAVPELIQVASTSKDAATRREAIFWLGQSKDPKALEYLEKVVKE
ncbi:MAG TPA: HEAT repeat domain-containing protein [Acidobacteriaceae bacterium]|nr:HEAT repeat domain-containing protein [Acidobacteriaceae bacterium]